MVGPKDVLSTRSPVRVLPYWTCINWRTSRQTKPDLIDSGVSPTRQHLKSQLSQILIWTVPVFYKRRYRGTMQRDFVLILGPECKTSHIPQNLDLPSKDFHHLKIKRRSFLGRQDRPQEVPGAVWGQARAGRRGAPAPGVARGEQIGSDVGA